MLGISFMFSFVLFLLRLCQGEDSNLSVPSSESIDSAGTTSASNITSSLFSSRQRRSGSWSGDSSSLNKSTQLHKHGQESLSNSNLIHTSSAAFLAGYTGSGLGGDVASLASSQLTSSLSVSSSSVSHAPTMPVSSCPSPVLSSKVGLIARSGSVDWTQRRRWGSWSSQGSRSYSGKF